MKIILLDQIPVSAQQHSPARVVFRFSESLQEAPPSASPPLTITRLALEPPPTPAALPTVTQPGCGLWEQAAQEVLCVAPSRLLSLPFSAYT